MSKLVFGKTQWQEWTGVPDLSYEGFFPREMERLRNTRFSPLVLSSHTSEEEETHSTLELALDFTADAFSTTVPGKRQTCFPLQGQEKQ